MILNKRVKHLLVLIFLINSQICYNQHIISGKVIDKDDCSNLPFTNFFSLKNQTGFVCDKEGFYIIKTAELIDSVIVSCLGYRDTIIALSVLIKASEIKLTKQIYSLEEVVIKNPQTKYKLKEIGFYSNRIGPSVSSSNLKVYLDNPFVNYMVKIQTLKFTIAKPFGTPLPFRVRICSNNKGKRGNDLIHDEIIFDKYDDEKEQHIELDLSKYNVIIPSDGIYVCFESMNVNNSLRIGNSPFFGIKSNTNSTLQVGAIVKVYNNL